MSEKLINNEEFKEMSLEMLKYFDAFCRQNNLRYYLFYGSLLGAIRHNGFIPWDDDLDVIMPRPDYERLVDLFNKSNERYQLYSIHTNENFNFPLAKIVDTHTRLERKGFKDNVELGLYIDVFILDGMPDDKEKQKEIYAQTHDLFLKCWRTSMSFRQENNSLIKDVLRYVKRLPEHIHGVNNYLTEMDTLSKTYDFDTSEYVCNLSYSVYYLKDIFEKKYFQVSEHLFEGMMCYVPSCAEELLKQIYGDWKKLPPEEKRVGIHDYKCYLIK